MTGCSTEYLRKCIDNPKLLTLLTLLLTLCLTCALAKVKPTTYTSGDYEYILLADGTAEITHYMGYADNLTIPAELDGHSVTTIGDGAFDWCWTLTSITIPRDSFAEQYCIDNDLPYAYPDANDWLLN